MDAVTMVMASAFKVIDSAVDVVWGYRFLFAVVTTAMLAASALLDARRS